jgi:chaperone BCS1
MVERERQQTAMDSTVGAPFETLTLTTAAWHRSVFDEILREARDKALAKEEGRTVIYHACGHDWRPFGPPKRIRPMESVVLADGVAEMLIADVEDFRRRGDWYADRGIPYRRGYLLHGPPGSGKSSFTLALAGMLRVGVAALNVGDPTLTDERCRRRGRSSLAVCAGSQAREAIQGGSSERFVGLKPGSDAAARAAAHPRSPPTPSHPLLYPPPGR